jgi:periplasmic protein TonB
MEELNGYRRNALPRSSHDPMARVLATGPRLPVSATVACAIFLHVGMAAGATAASLFDEIFAWQRGIRDVIAYRLGQYEVEIQKEEPPTPPEPPKEEAPEPPKPMPKEAPPPPPPQPAEAAKVLTADPQPSDKVEDLTAFVTGSGTTYAGGTTSAQGTSKTAVYNPAAAATGVPGGTGTAPAPPSPKTDRSRAPGLLGASDWSDCPFPREADAEQIDQAFVIIQVTVKPDGSPENVNVLKDPGHGFAREARRCAMMKKYSQGLDPDGNAIGGQTKPFRVRFER